MSKKKELLPTDNPIQECKLNQRCRIHIVIKSIITATVRLVFTKKLSMKEGVRKLQLERISRFITPQANLNTAVMDNVKMTILIMKNFDRERR